MSGRAYWQKSYSGGPINVAPQAPGLPGDHYKPVVVPNGAALPFKIVDGVKVFHLVAEEVDHAFDSGLRAKCWGYNGRVNSTIIEAVEGERIRIYVTNRLPVATSVHWHGIYLPNGMDGVGGLTQPYIKAGETVKYEWTLRQHGSFMFHSHHDEMTQMGMGMIGMFIVHPRNPSPDYRVDRDFSLMISEWSVKAGTARPNTLEMTDFNVLTINGKVFPSTAPLVCKTGDRVRLRLGNLGAMDHHPMHIHGYHFRITATDGEDIPLSAQWPETTVLVAVGQTRNVEFVADAPGDWAFHCHMTHHVMNQMGHEFPNMVGVNPAGRRREDPAAAPGVHDPRPHRDGHGQDGRGHAVPPEHDLHEGGHRSLRGLHLDGGPLHDRQGSGWPEELRRGSRLVSASSRHRRAQGERWGPRARRHRCE